MPGGETSLYVEVGSTGLTRFGSHVYEEWVRPLQGIQGIKVYREMRDNDSIVGAFLYALEMLIRQVTWRVDAASSSPQDVGVAEFVESCLYDMSQSWEDTLSEILSMLVYGWCFLEIVYKKRVGPEEKDGSRRSKYTDGRIGWRKWAIRAQETLHEWVFDEEGGIAGMKQLAPPDYQVRFIPIEKGLLFRTKSSKGNPEGRSLLRNAYRPWYFKKNIEEIEAIGIERDLAGLPVLWLPPEIIRKTDAEASRAYTEWKKILTNVKRDEQEGIMIPLVYDDRGNKLYDFSLLSTGSRRQFDTNAIIQRYDQRIAMTVMADFLLLGHDKVGSFALSSDKTSLFATALGALLKSITSIINSYAIPRLVSLNAFTNLSGYPTLEHSDIETPDLGVLGDFIQKLTGAGMQFFPDDDLENYLREIASLPRKSEESSQSQVEREEFVETVKWLKEAVQKIVRD